MEDIDLSGSGTRNEDPRRHRFEVEPASNGLSASVPFAVRLGWLIDLERWMEPTAVEARLLSLISILVTIMTFSIGLIFAVVAQSSVMLAFSLEALVDIISSVIVYWRFAGPAEQTLQMRGRETRASVGIGLSFVLTGVVVLIDSLVHISQKSPVKDARALLGISIPSFLILLSLGSTKIYCARKLRSDALFEDGMCSLGSAIISMSVFLSIFVHRSHERIWFLDETFALIVAVIFFLYGFWIVTPHPWFSWSFWIPLEREEEEKNSSTKIPPSFGETYGSSESMQTV